MSLDFSKKFSATDVNMRKNYLLFVSFLQAQMERNFYYPLSVDTDLQFLRFFFFLFTRIGVLSDLKKKKKLFHLKRIEKGEKKRIFCETRGFPNSFTFYYTTFLSRDEIIMPGLLPPSHHGPHVTSCIATFSANILSPRASPPAPFASRLFARQ